MSHCRSEADPLQDAHILHRLMVYETACALAESASLADAAPRMLQAVCGSLGWEYGALWEVDRARTTVRWVSSWQERPADFEEFIAVSRQTTSRPWDGPARPGLGDRRAGVDSRHRARRQLPAGGHRGARGPAQRVCHADAAWGRRARRDGVLQPRHPPARRGPGPDARHGRARRSACTSTGSARPRSWIASSPCRSTSSASRTSTATSSA